MEAGAAEAANWKREVSARVQAHRVRRQAHPSARQESRSSRNMPPRLAGVAATVAERYADAPSYSQYLDKLEGALAEPAQPQDLFATEGSSALDIAPAEVSEPDALPRVAPARVVFPPELEAELHAPSSMRANRLQHALTPAHPENFLQHAPIEMVEPDVPIAPKLIEFPRQLVASRRSRPRLAEGPLREESPPEPGEQLRIFEVEPEQISRVPLAAQTTASSAAAAPAEWRYIQLDTPLLTSPVPEADADYFAPTLHIAPLPRRALAAALDVGLVALAFLFFAVSFTAVASGPPSDLASLFASAIIFAALLAGYQWLFFTLSDATPGMRYARIALCTFEDDNPNPRQRRMRIVASALSAASAGLGYAWIWFDHERLGWHDRISHTYQRCY
jgi:uncharacterized RDD family membrane protein YckC